MSEHMSAERFRSVRVAAGMSQSETARFLRISDKRVIRNWEAGERAISGPVSLLMDLLDAGVIGPDRPDKAQDGGLCS